MKSTNLNIFLQLGSEIRRLCEHVHTGQDLADLWIYSMTAQQWLFAFLHETEPIQRQLTDSRMQITNLLDAIARIHTPQRLKNGPVDQYECGMILDGVTEFEKAFEREYRNLAVFVVTPKGTRDTSILIENPEADFTETQRRVLPPQFVADLREAARCLVFEVPTACAFDVCRATEAMMIAYYELLANKPWPFSKRDWKIYIEQLNNLNAPKKITARLDEIREMDRNAHAHPDVNVTKDEAPLLYGLCSGVNYYMAEEMVKGKI